MVNDDLLKESLLELYEGAPCGYIFTAPDGTFLRVNQTFLAWTGYKRTDLISKRRLQDLLTVPGRLFYENQYAPLLRMQGFVNEVALDIVRPERDPLPVLVNSVQHTRGGHGATDEPRFIASIVFDATGRRAYERELLRARQDAERLAVIVAASNDAILSASPERVVETWNPGAERLFGRPASEMVGRALGTALPVAARAQDWAALEDSLQRGQPVYIDTIGIHANGETIDVSVSFTPHFGPLGELSAISSIIRDIRQRRAAERLEQEFLAMASHELRSPLSTIKGHAQLMQRQGRYNERGAQTIVSQVDHLNRLVSDLLLASQAASGRLDTQTEVLDLCVEARQAAATLVRPTGPPVDVLTPDQPVLVQADSLRLRQVLANLLTNAGKYAPADSPITVRVAPVSSDVDTRHASVSVEDRGPGIPPDALPRLFDRFFRVGATAHTAQGLGLGLYISLQLIKAMGGTISVQSEEGRGSTFTVTLPLATAAGSATTSGAPA